MDEKEIWQIRKGWIIARYIEITFVLITLVTCLCYSHTLGYGQVYDERSSFNTSYVWMNRMLGRQVYVIDSDYKGIKGSDVVCLEIDKDDECIISGIEDMSNMPEINDGYQIVQVMSYAPFPTYFVDAIVLVIGKTLSISGYMLFYLVRYANMVIYILMALLAMNICKTMKLFSFVLFSMPMAVMHAITCNYNALYFPFVFLVTILICHYIYEAEELSVKDIVILYVLIALVAPIKGYMIGIAFLILLIKKEKVRNKRYFYIMGIFVALLVWIVYNLGSVDIRGVLFGTNNDYIAYSNTYRVSIADFIKHPSNLKPILDKALFDFIRLDSFGNAHSPIELGRIISSGYLICFLVSALSSKAEENGDKRVRQLFMCVLYFAMFILLCALTMISWNGSVPDIKPLYYVPYYGLLGMIAREAPIIYIGKHREAIIVSSVVCLSILSCGILLARYGGIS